MKYLYLLLNIGSIVFPLIFSFHHKIKFYEKWKYLLPAILIMAIPFLTLDFLFTEWGIWSFNDAYITGVKVLGLPLEEILFYICIPYSCLFIYELLIIYQVKNYLRRARLISWLVMVGLAATLVFNYMYLYTGVAFLVTTSYLFQLVTIHRAQWLGRFYLGFGAALIPLLLVNAILTALPVIVYNPTEIMGVRIATIPAENVVYLFLMLLLTTALYERFQGRYKRIKNNVEDEEEDGGAAGETDGQTLGNNP